MLEVQISMFEMSKSTTRVNDTENISIKMLCFYQVVARHQCFSHSFIIYLIFFTGGTLQLFF